jgi:Zn-dependent protease with chaperone function
MNFFDHQDRARSTTKKLVVLFFLAIVVLIAMTSFLIISLFFVAENNSSGDFAISQEFLTSDIVLLVTLGVVAVVGLGSVYRFIQLRGGGKSVAESMGGRLLNTGTLDADERKILNVVEEMALASGLPVPPVYLMEDSAINAFAAGYHSKDAVIGITRGCIKILSREELQGVVAHEFSHIFNGDMRLNIRLMGVLYGIMVLGTIGYVIVRSSRYRMRSRNSKGNGIIVLGLGLIVIGYGGTFFGNMIKAAVSRQREFLADASAVQFTRNPDGIGGALKKIGGYDLGSTINNDKADEISHMLFAEGLASRFTGLMATHPPLQERILKIEPNWQGQLPTISEGYSAGDSGSHFSAGSEQASGFNSAANSSAIDAIGSPTAEHIAIAIDQLAQMPEDLKAEAHTTFGASSLMYCLLVKLADDGTAQKQLAILKEGLSQANYAEQLIILEKAQALPRELYLPLVDLALPSLKQFSPTQYRTFMSFLSQLIVADQEISLFEWSLFKILRSNLDPSSLSRQQVDMKSLRSESEVLLSALASAGHDSVEEAERSFNQAKVLLSFPKGITYNNAVSNNTQLLEKAVDKFQNLKPLQKPLLIKSMVKCIDADGKVTPEERELLRAVASLIDCPIPPLLSGQSFL